MKVAIVHYWLINMRGGEKVIETLLEMFPQADIFTHVYNPKEMPKTITSKRVFTSSVNRLPFAKKLYQTYMPFMPKALMEFNLQEYDLVISSESGPAKGVIPNPNAFHLCYCHTPMRYLWDIYHDYFKNTNLFIRFFMKRLIPNLRNWDITSSNLVDCFISNSEFVAKRINRYYNREAFVVHPPVDIERYLAIQRQPLENQDYYFFFGQLTSYKRLDLAIDACILANKKLIICGIGADKKIIKNYKSNKLIKFIGKSNKEEIDNLFSGAKALLFPGIEDFGIIPVEAQAAGCPVIAYRDGGALETIKENVTGIFFNEQTAESLANAIMEFEKTQNNFLDRAVFTEWVKQFSSETFKEKVTKIISEKKRI